MFKAINSIYILLGINSNLIMTQVYKRVYMSYTEMLFQLNKSSDVPICGPSWNQSPDDTERWLYLVYATHSAEDHSSKSR